VGSEHLTYDYLVEFAAEMRQKTRAPLNCWVMNEHWRDRLAAESPLKDDVPWTGIPLPLDYVLAMPIYVDEAYDTPILRNAADYLAEVAGRQPEWKRVVDW
jgi:hypothetical protein